MVQEVEKEKGEGREEKWRQYVSSLSVLCVAVLVGLPLWWKTTEVYRCPLPYAEIQHLNLQQVPPVLLYSISVLVLYENEETEASFVAELRRELGNHTVKSDDVETSLSYLVKPLTLEHAMRDDIKEAISAKASLTPLLPPSQPGHYTIVVALGDESVAGSQVVVSSSRWSVIHTTRSGPGVESAVSDAVDVIREIVAEEQLLQRVLEGGRVRERGSWRRDMEDMRQIRAAQGYQVSLTLLVPDPSRMTVTWNIDTATNSILMPFLHHPGISHIANFTVSSQVFHYMDVKFTPLRSKSGRGHYVQSTSLPPMISSVESRLGSLVSQLPSLNFLVLVPQRGHVPLHIRDPHGQFTDNFLVPQWGGVVFYNPPEWDREGEGEEGGGVVRVEMERVMSVFVRQLQLLLGVPPSSPQVVPDPGNLGITEWQVDQLLVARMLESISTATTALVSLVELLDKVKNMVISDVIQQEVVSSLSSLQECYRLAGLGDIKAAYSHAREAMVSAEKAFYDPSILELLYFPDDQKFAIYIPLFLPISIPIGMSSLAAVRWITSILRPRPLTPENQ